MSLPQLQLLLLGAVLTSRAAPDCSAGEAAAALDEDRFLGVWYNIKQTTWDWPEGRDLKCPNNIFSKVGEGDLIMDVGFYNKSSSSAVNFRNTLHKSTPGSTNGKYDGGREGGRNYTVHVVKTDYTSYALMRACGYKQNSEETYVSNYLLAREDHPSAAVLNTQMPPGSYSLYDHEDCPPVSSP
ncbi:uncharacterized protein LOC134529842 [Bacillus rossius redtenbacheri]|uniref:uncharacterized protein LOC134529842 n=1 Tax=Bacillus rossius redtenbacheri TaxID=93214 RepID=UPI002FDCE643